MIQIQPIQLGLPSKECNELFVRPIIDNTQSIDCNTYYEVIACEKVITTDEQGVETITENRQMMANGNIPINEEEYTLWADDNAFIENIILQKLGLQRA